MQSRQSRGATPVDGRNNRNTTSILRFATTSLRPEIAGLVAGYRHERHARSYLIGCPTTPCAVEYGHASPRVAHAGGDAVDGEKEGSVELGVGGVAGAGPGQE